MNRCYSDEALLITYGYVRFVLLFYGHLILSDPVYERPAELAD